MPPWGATTSIRCGARRQALGSCDRVVRSATCWAPPEQCIRALAIAHTIITRIDLWKTESLLPLARTPRTLSVAQVAGIATSMRESGFLWPIMVNGETCEIVAGNGRYLAAVQLGRPTVPVVEERPLTEVPRRAFIIADNKIALNAGWSKSH